MYKTPLISIIVPVYNSSKFLSRCIESILIQMWTNFELILVNDGSTDNSREICENYRHRDPRIIVINQTNQGVSIARNNGLKVSNGKYVTFIDSDDFVKVDYISSFDAENDHDIISQGAIIKYERSGIEINNKYHKTKSCTLNEFYSTSVDNNLILAPWAKLFKLSIIKNNNITFNAKISYGEDTLFVAEYLSYCKTFKIIGESNYYYVQDENENRLTSSDHSAEGLMILVNESLLLNDIIINKANISQEISNKVMITLSRDFYGSIIKLILNNQISFNEKQKFISNINSDLFKRFYKQKGLLPIHRCIAILKRLLPIKQFILSIQMLLWIYNLKSHA